MGLKYTGIDNLTIGFGHLILTQVLQDGGSDSNTIGVKYAIGGVTLGYQITEVDKSANDEDATHVWCFFCSK